MAVTARPSNRVVPLRVGLVGIGRWGRILAASLLERDALACALGRGSEENRQELKKRFPDVPISESLDAMLADPSLDAIVVATPIKTHFKIAMMALRAGKHVMIEKPMTATWEQAEQLAAVAAEERRVLFVGHVFLFHPALDAIESRRGGEMFESIRMSWRKNGTFQEPLTANLLTHEIAIAERLMGPIDSLKVVRFESLVTDCDRLKVDLRFESGATGSIDVDRSSTDKTKEVEVTGPGTSFHWVDDALWSRSQGELGWSEVGLPTELSPVDREVRAFFEAIDSDLDPWRTTEVGVSAVKWAEHAQDQIR